MTNYRAYKLLVNVAQKLAHPSVTGLKQEVSKLSGHKNHLGCLLETHIPELHTQKV